ncbi:2517_t:CDS:2 [Dentiscutata erythropus]|uniref:2517_t:CDS:1 n=1 Tax=Dentiscutata erythropus TaxID=1348616 RepID=A0A9N9NSD5_9GLOM|nr:2517_t:CDS:2 [Dentiscutata erythropus]
MGCFSSKLREESETMDSENTQTEFRFSDGRRYHNVEGAVYPMPNDEDEQDRLHLQHFLMRYLWQSNFSAPINHILTKPGSKIIDIAYQAIDVVGLDISPLQPTQIKPKNFTYVKANVLEEIPFEDCTFDFVYQRFMSYAYTKDEWPSAMNELVRILKPGGFIELMEPSPELFDLGPIAKRLWGAQTTLVTQRGVDLNVYQKLEKILQDQGQLENIKKEVKIIRHGINNNIELNKVDINNIVSIMGGMKTHTTKVLQISDDEFDELLKAAEKELYETDFNYHLVRVYASKLVADN